VNHDAAAAGGTQTPLERRILALDETLMGLVETQTTLNDRRSLIALHAACRMMLGEFAYLEVGSHLGGSLQALVADPACTDIVSIDSRPAIVADNRPGEWEYMDNSSERMLRELERVPGADLSKIVILEAETSDLAPENVPVAPALCFVDGEHTDAAMLRDADFCLSVIGEQGCIAFHDSSVIWGGLETLENRLREAGRSFTVYYLPDTLFVFEIGEARLLSCWSVQEMLVQNYRGFLWSMREVTYWAKQ
jgi:methyltransferase family protein